MATPTAFEFEIQSDLGNVAQRLSQVHRLLGDDKQRAKLMNGIATILENSTRKRFETKTDPEGNAWEGWAENTRKLKKYRKRDERKRLLRDSNTLLKSITRHATSQLAQVGTNRHYAPYLQLGTKHMAARPFFGISSTDREDMGDLLTTWLGRIWETKA